MGMFAAPGKDELRQQASFIGVGPKGRADMDAKLAGIIFLTRGQQMQKPHAKSDDVYLCNQTSQL
jgi:hypothetical protein